MEIWNIKKWCAAFVLSAAICAGAEPPMGSVDAHASGEHPFGWRGDGTGKFPGATPPTKWDEKENVTWSVAVGKGYSSPVLTEKVVLVTVEPDFLVCVDRVTGKEKWRVQPELKDEKERDAAEAYKLPKDGAGMAAATPITDGATVFAVFANGVVHAVDMEGKTKWTAFIGAEQNTGYGRSASPLLVGGKLIVHMTNLYALDPATGKQLWVNEDATSTYATPAVIKSQGVDLIVTSAGDVVRADTGKTVNTKIGRTNYVTPVVDAGVIYFADNAVTAVRLSAGFKDEEIWNAPLQGEIIGSPICHKGMLFTVTCAGDLFGYALDNKGESKAAIKGRALLEEKKAEDGGDGGGGAGGAVMATPRVFASLALAGDYLFLATTQEVLILEATPEAKLVRKIPMPGGSAPPVFSGSEMFLRSGEKLFCISVPATTQGRQK